MEKSIERADQDVTRRKGQKEAFAGNNLSRIEPVPEGDSPVGSEEIFGEAEPTLVRSALGAPDVSQAEIIGDMIAEMGQKLAETLNKTLGRVLDRIGPAGAPGGGGGDDGDDDDPPDPRDRSRRGKTKSFKEDDESSEGGEPFRRPLTTDFYEGRGGDPDRGDKSAFDFGSKDRLLRLMDANEKLGAGTKRVSQDGLGNLTEFVTTSREHLTIDKYFLGGHPPDTYDLFRFMTMYEENIRKEPTGQLLLSKFIRLEYLTILEHNIIRHKTGRFRHHYILMQNNGGHIYREGSQAMPNSALAEVITYVASPRSRYQTYQMLCRSVFPYKNWEKYTSMDYIQSHLRGFLHEWLAFRSRFESYLDLMKHVRKHLPPFYMRKQQEDGLLDFMIKTSPCPKWMYMVLKEAKEGERKNKIKDKDDWDVIMQKLEDMLEYLADQYDRAEDTNQRFLSRGRHDYEYRAPYEVEVGARRKERERSRVNAVADHVGDAEGDPHVTFQLPEWQDEDFEETEPEDEGPDREVEEDGYDTAPETHHAERTREVYESAVHRELREDEDAYLRGLKHYEETCLKQMESVVHKGRNVCWSFADTGKCAFESEGKTCRFSHEPQDVERYKLAKSLGPKIVKEGFGRIQLKMNPGRVGSATSPGPRGTSPGARPPFRDGRTPATHGRRSSYPPKRN